MKPTYLYIKEHTKTGLKYFGKTTKQDPVSYLGSGKIWTNHIKKHGKEFVKTTWYQLFTDEKELIEYAINFSSQNNIVESDAWANLKTENGFDGGGWPIGYRHKQGSIESNRQKAIERWKNGVYDPEKLRLSRIGFKQPESQKEKVSKALSKKWLITDPNGNTFMIENLRKFCLDNKLDQGNMMHVVRGRQKQHKGYVCSRVP